MNKEFVPQEHVLELKKLGFDEPTPLYEQAFSWLKEKYGFTYSVGNTNIGIVHVGTTFLLQDNASFEEAQLECLKKLIEVAINRIS